MTPPFAASALGYAGLIPFFAAAALATAGPPETEVAARAALLLYGGLILSFMGGCRWGFAAAGLGAGPSFLALGIAVAPSLWAFAVLGAALIAPQATPFWAAALALAVGFAALFIVDRRAAATGDAPAWWPSLRAPLTAGACAALLGAAAF